MKIRTKLAIGFAAVALPILIIGALIGVYNQRSLRAAIEDIEVVSLEIGNVHAIERAMEKAVMSTNDYIITGKKSYIDEFRKHSTEMTRLLNEVADNLRGLRRVNGERAEKESRILDSVREAWTNVRKISRTIFEIPDPVGDRSAARLMEEMDYRWLGPATSLLTQWHALDSAELTDATGSLNQHWTRAWRVMAAGLALLSALGAYLVYFLSKRLVGPIEHLQEGAAMIAEGNLDYRVIVDSGDEIELLAGEFNEMAIRLGDSYSSLEDKVAERTAELKREEERLRESEQRFREFFENEPAYCYMVSTEGTIMDVNKAALTALGYSKGELVGSPLRKVYAPEAMARLRECFEKWKECGELRDEEITIITKRGERRTVLLNAGTVRDAEGKVLHSISVQQDITERTRVEEHIRRQADITRDLLRISEAAIRTTDMGRLMREVTGSVARITSSDMCLSYLWEPGTLRFRPAEGSGLAQEQIPVFMTSSLDMDHALIREAVETGDVRLSGERGDEEVDPFAWTGPVSITAVIPLLGRRAYLGIMACIYFEGNPRTAAGLADVDMDLLSGIGNQVSTALEEARLYQDSINKAMELSHKIETIEAMHEIDRAILSTLDPQEILEVAVNIVSKLVPCDTATTLILDSESGGLVIKAGFGLKVEPGAAPVADETALEAVRTMRPVYVSNIQDKANDACSHNCTEGGSCRSRLVLPLAIKGEAAGVLSVCSSRRSAFTPDDLSTLEKLATQIGIALDNARLVQDLRDLFIGIIKSLSETIDAKSPWTRGHSERVTKIALEIARNMGMSGREIEEMEVAGLLHDIGKIGTVETILDKPGKLTDEELKNLSEHPERGAEILRPIKPLGKVLPIIRHHHEHFDGNGYPYGLAGTDIPLGARILAVADTVDAMGSDRPYRKGRSREAIVAELKRCSSTQFDPRVVEACLKILNAETPAHPA